MTSGRRGRGGCSGSKSIAYVLVGALALLTLTLTVVLAPLIWNVAVSIAPHIEPLDRFVTLSRFGIATLVLLLALVTVHKLLPAGRRTLRQILPGVVFTFGLWVAGGVVFGSYLAKFARNYVTTYAGLASVMIALVFLYMVAAIFIFGGELNEALCRAAKRRADAKAGFPK